MLPIVHYVIVIGGMEMNFNFEETLNYVRERQKAKFPNCPEKEMLSKLLDEIAELKEEIEQSSLFGENSHYESIQLEKADVIIMATGLWKEYKNPLAWFILDLMKDDKLIPYILKKWEIVENRNYKRVNGKWQH